MQRPAWLVRGVAGRVCRGRLSSGRSGREPAPRHPDFSLRGPHQTSAPRHGTSRRRCAASPRLHRNCYTRRKRVCTPGRASFEGRGPRPQARPPGPRWLRLPSWGASVRFVGSHGPRFFTFFSSLSSRFAVLCLTWSVVFSTIRFYEVTRHHSDVMLRVGLVKVPDLWGLALPLTTCVSFSHSLDFSELRFPHP